MPLPAALAARLAKRGLLQVEEPTKVTVPEPNEEVEEVFAEDYDDLTTPIPLPDNTSNTVSQPEALEEDVEKEDEEEDAIIYEASACPNKWNKYHKCVDFCRTHWGLKEFKHKDGLDSKRDRMLRKYPLPEGWMEVADPETGRYYYWNTETDQVSWLSPQHPRATITLSKDKIQNIIEGGMVSASTGEDDSDKEGEMDVDQGEEEDEEEDDDLPDDFEDLERELMQEREERNRRSGHRDRDRDRDRDRKGRRRERDSDKLDPMDPASYSDVPRGTWSTGLELRGEAKTGVDTTASGPLFQQRPYPSPGAVLRANKEMGKKS